MLDGGPGAGPARGDWIAQVHELIGQLEGAAVASRALVERLSAVAHVTKQLFDAMEFGFLFHPARKIFSIGYRVTEGSLDPSAYDLLASEARLASFIAIANGGAPTSHWFHLGRPMTPVGLGAALVSWSGSMFEYLMPALVMQAPPGSLLQQTYRLVVQRQIGYGAEHGIPWGISESAYNVRDLDLTYQYSNFGVPGLGLERGLSEDLVVAPYATALAAMVDPGAAARNFTRLIAVGGEGSLRLLRGARLHAVPAPGGDDRGDRSRLHGAPSGHDPHRAGECAPRWGDARAVSRGAHHPGHRASPAGAGAPGRGGGETAGGRGAGAGPCAGVRGAILPSVHVSARPDAADAPALQRPVHGDADDRGLGLQPVRGARRHPMAGGRHPGSLGDLSLPAGRPERGGLVGGVSAHRRRAGRLSRDLLRGPRRAVSTRWCHHDHARGAGLAGG